MKPLRESWPQPRLPKRRCAKPSCPRGGDLKGKGINANWVCKEGVPAREIIASAAKNKVDLIAMATNGRGEVAWVLGSTAERVASHATVPVLLFRVMEFKPPVLKEEFFL